MKPVFLFVILATFLALPSLGQEVVKDTLAKNPIPATQALSDSAAWLQTDSAATGKKHSPRKATIYSLLLPGLGQAYNGEYWKIPIIYGIGAVCVYFIVDNHQNWKAYNGYVEQRQLNEAYRAVGKSDRINTYDPFDKNNPINIADRNNRTYETPQLILLRDGYRRDRDFTIILLSLTYALNIVDATVFAHLKEFKVSRKTAMRLDPDIKMAYYKPYMGVNLRLTF